MIKVLLVLHVFITLALIGVVLIQRSEGGGLGLGASQGMGSFMSGRGTANLLTRTTAILGTAFFLLSLGLALLYRGGNGESAAAILAAPAPRNVPGTATGAPTPLNLPSTPADARPAGANGPATAPAPAAPFAVPTPAVPGSPGSAPAKGQ